MPILWRTHDTIQIGDDVIVDRVTRAHVAWLTSLDGLATVDHVVESLTIDDHEAARLVRAARAAGALDDCARMPAAHRWLPRDARDQATAAFAVALQTHRDLATALAVIDRRDRTRVGIVGTGLVADAIDAVLLATSITRDDLEPSLTVLADAPHPDAPALMDHVDLDRPHLHVGVFGRRAVVGPLVVPGRTSCLRCAHLHRRDCDPAWPLLAVQWSHAVTAMRPAPLDPLLATLAAAHAALMVRSWADSPDDAQSWADVAVELTLPEGQARRLPRPPHPLCGCRWSSR